MSNPPEPDDEFWLEDANVSLVARGVDFRVYRGLLSSQSPVFSALLSTPSTLGRSTENGLSILNVSDSPKDLRHLLRVLVPLTGKR